MKLRITGGSARGRVLRGELGPGVRPTSARVREAWFSMVGQDLSGRRFLDAYAGSGIMGLEAWSRGATVVAVERDRRAARAIRERVAELSAAIEVRVADATRVDDAFDLVFADPPYALDPVSIAAALAPRAGVLGIEARRGQVLPQLRGVRAEVRRFGDTELHLYRFEEAG